LDQQVWEALQEVSEQQPLPARGASGSLPPELLKLLLERLAQAPLRALSLRVATDS